jgi:hypothetical protein
MAKEKLSSKHQLMAKNLIKHKGNQKLAYLDTYPSASVSSATALSSRLLASKPEILDEARQSLIKQGVSLDVLSKKLREKLDSTKMIVVDNDTIEVSDNQAQLKATELAYKVHGALKDNDNSVNINVQHNQAIILDKLGARLDAVLRMFEPLQQEALSDASIYRKVSGDVKNNPQHIYNLPQDTSHNEVILSDVVLTTKKEDTDSEPTSGGTAPV